MDILADMVTSRQVNNICLLDSKGRNVLHLAILGKVWTTIGALVNIEKKDLFCGNGHHEALLMGVDDEKRNVLHYAAMASDIPHSIVTLLDALELFSAGASLHLAVDAKGRTALDYAIIFKRKDSLKLLATCQIDAKIAKFKALQGTINDKRVTDSLPFLIEHLTIRAELTPDSFELTEQQSSFFLELIE
eukprot:gene44329-55127_t